MSKFSEIKTDLKTHWKQPDTAKGKYVSWREHLDIFMGVCMNYAAQSPLGYIGFGASCFLIMYHYKLPYIAFSVIGLIGIPLSYLWNIFAWIIADNLGFLPRKTEKKFYTVYAAAAVIGLLLLLTDVSSLMNQSGWLVTKLNSIEGISARSFFKIFGVQQLVTGIGGIRSIFYRKKLVPKYGRFKYSLYSDVFQKCIMVILIGWLPIYNIQNVDERVWLAYLLFSVYGMYDFSNKVEECTTLISPNWHERLWVRSYTVKISHLLNSAFVAIIPLLGKFDDINFYRYVIPGVFIFCAALTMVFAGKVQERIPQPPIEKKQTIPFWYGVFQVFRNKYHWLNTLSGVIDSLGNGMLNIATVIYLYTMRLSGLEYSLLGLLWSFRTTIPTFFAPHFMNKYSYKQLRIFKQFIEIGNCVFCLTALTLLKDNVIICGLTLFFSQFFRGFFAQITDVAQSDMNTRLGDYQMYLSGERISGLTGVFSWISSPITTVVGLIIPMLLLKNGFNTNWDVLLLDSARFNILAIPIIIDLVGHILIIFPYLFWDYNTENQNYVMSVLKQRAALAEEGYFPATYEGGLNFEQPELHGTMPKDLCDFTEGKEKHSEKELREAVKK